jgi:nucleoside-diphosphate-sugar epimerase
MLPNEKYLVTGAGGFIGGWIAETCFLRGSVNVRAGVRSWSGAVRLARFPMEIMVCDIMDEAQIDRALEGVTHVIHCAKGSRETIVRGTQNMLDASLRHGIERFVHISTAEVYGNQGGQVDEKSALKKTGDSYGDAKIEAENLCWQYSGKGLPLTVIRPSIVYGPFGKSWTVDIALKLQSGNWGVYQDAGDGACNLVYVSDLVSAILLAAKREQAVNEAFNVTGPELVSWNDYFVRFNTALGLPPLTRVAARQVSLRAMALEPLGRAARFAKRHFESPIKNTAARFGPAKRALKSVERALKTNPRSTDLALYGRDARYANTKAQELLGFRGHVDLNTGLELTIPWLRQVGFMDSTA